VRAQDASGSLFPDGSKAAPTPSPEPEARLDQRNQEFTDSLTARAALLAAYQFNSKLSVFAPLASDPIACATAYKGVAYFNTGTGAVKICDGSTWGTGGLGATAGGSTTQVQYNNAGALAGNAGFTFTAPTLNISGATTTGPDVEVSVTGDTTARVAIGMNTTDVPRLSMGPGNAVRDTFLRAGRGGQLAFRWGGRCELRLLKPSQYRTSWRARPTRLGRRSPSTALAARARGRGGSIIFKTAAAGSTGSTQNALATALTSGVGFERDVRRVGGRRLRGGNPALRPHALGRQHHQHVSARHRLDAVLYRHGGGAAGGSSRRGARPQAPLPSWSGTRWAA
jgi:hypothetical protein